MSNSSNARAFFQNLSIKVTTAQTAAQQSSLFGTARPTKQTSLQETLSPTTRKPSALQWKLDDFGVGLPPLANC